MVALADEFLEEDFFILARATGGDRTEIIAARGVNNRPVSPLDQADGKMAQFA